MTPRQTKPGSRVKLVRCADPETHLQPGSLGTVLFIDSMGTVHVNWDSGSSLGLCKADGDRYEVVK